MMRIRETNRVQATLMAWCCAIIAAAPIKAAPNAETTVIPLGNIVIKKGVQELSLRLPTATQDQPVQPIVLLAAQPGDPQMPATITIEIDGRKLPDWILTAEATGYAIGAATIRANPEFATQQLKVKFHLKSDAAELGALVLAMPDPSLIANKDGPLTEFAQAAPAGPVREYFTAMVDEFAGRQDAATAAYRQLSTSNDTAVGRFARRSCRRIDYLTRERRLSGNFMDHYRWGLCLQFWGAYRPAYEEFEECRIIRPDDAESQYRAGECLDLTASDLFSVMQYMDRVERVCAKRQASPFKLLVVVVKSRAGQTLSDEELARIADGVFIAKMMVPAATMGSLWVDAEIRTADDDRDAGLALTSGVWTPGSKNASYIDKYDGVITIGPRHVGATGDAGRIAPERIGPIGTIVGSAPHDISWQGILGLFYQMIAESAAGAVALDTLPPLDHALTACFGPSPHLGFSLRSALHYAAPRDAFAAIGTAAIPPSDTYLQLWRFDGPLQLTSGSHDVFDGLGVATGNEGAARVFDGARITPPKELASGSYRATCWVYMVSDRVVQLRTERQGPIGVRVNGYVERTGLSGDATSIDSSGIIGSGILLERGWNTVEFVVPSTGSASDSSFAAALLTTTGMPVGGVAVSHSRPDQRVVALHTNPDAERRYSWPAVRDDWRRLPIVNLAERTGVSNLRIVASIASRDGFVAIDVPDRAAGAGYREVPTKWNAGADSDWRLNNVLDFRREWCMAVEGATNRQFLLVRPMAAEAIAHCLKETDGAIERFGGKAVMDRVVGRIEVDSGERRVPFIVFEVSLGDAASWPADEEDLLTPFGSFVPNPSTPAETGPVPQRPAGD